MICIHFSKELADIGCFLLTNHKVIIRKGKLHVIWAAKFVGGQYSYYYLLLLLFFVCLFV